MDLIFWVRSLKATIIELKAQSKQAHLALLQQHIMQAESGNQKGLGRMEREYFRVQEGGWWIVAREHVHWPDQHLGFILTSFPGAWPSTRLLGSMALLHVVQI